MAICDAGALEQGLFRREQLLEECEMVEVGKQLTILSPIPFWALRHSKHLMSHVIFAIARRRVS
jgi:hypothetical protein